MTAELKYSSLPLFCLIDALNFFPSHYFLPELSRLHHKMCFFSFKVFIEIYKPREKMTLLLQRAVKHAAGIPC